MDRSEEQALAGLLPIRMGGTVHAVPTLKIKDSRKWREKVREKLGFDPGKLDLSTDPFRSIAAIADTDQLLDLVMSFDTTHVLGTKAHIESTATDEEVWVAVWDMLGATFPLVARGRSAVEAYGLEEIMRLAMRLVAPSNPENSRSSPSPNGLSTLTPSQLVSPTSS